MKHAMLTLIGVAAVFGSARAQDDPAAKVRNRIATMRVDLDFSGARLRDVIAYLQEYSGLNFHVDAAIDAKGDDERVTIKVKAVTLKSALKLVLNPRNLGCVYRDGVLQVLPKSKLSDRAVTRVYDVRDLAFGIQDFPGPKMELAPPGSRMVDVIFDLQDEPTTTLPADFLADLIKANVGGTSWSEGPNLSIEQINGLLVISQTSAVHDEISILLNRLRQYK